MTDIYWNSRRKLYSVRERGKVVDHVPTLVVASATFLVSEAGRQRVLRTGQKNVHAFIRATIVKDAVWWPPPPQEMWARVTYHPFTDDTFQSEGKPLRKSYCALLVIEDGHPVIYVPR